MQSIREFVFCYIFSLFLFMISDGNIIVNGSRERLSNVMRRNITNVDPNEFQRASNYYNPQWPMYFRNQLIGPGKIAPPNMAEYLPPYMSPHYRQYPPFGYPPYGHRPNQGNNSLHVFFILPRLDSAKSECPPSMETTKSVLITRTRGPTAPPKCKPRFSRVGKHCYYVSMDNATWYSARDTCQDVGAHLAYPIDANENALLAAHIEKQTTDQRAWWIGGTKKKGQFVWDKTKSPISYDEWNIGEPDNYTGKENCMFYTNNFKWSDGSCHWSLPYVCQH